MISGRYIWHLSASEIMKQNRNISGLKDPSKESISHRSIFSDSMESRRLLYEINQDKDKENISLESLTEIVQVSFSSSRSMEKNRALLYEEGFNIKGIHYVRYKRTASSAREGNCYFIQEKYKEKMEAWALAGLSYDNKKVMENPVSFESYQALTLSNICASVKIPKKAILIIPDAKSNFKEDCYAVFGEGDLTVEEKVVEIENTIWDGEGLLDESCFKEFDEHHSMMLLRNKFFKCCAFNTKLQKWLKKYATLGGLKKKKGFFTLAKRIEDIKLVCTYSSLKYLKFAEEDNLEAQFNKWISDPTFEEEFGICKFDKKSKYFDGDMVKSSYTLLNTLALTKEDIASLFEPTIKYRECFKNDVHVFSYDLNQNHKKNPLDDAKIQNYKYQIVKDLLNRKQELYYTPLIKDFRRYQTDNLLKEYKKGRILIEGRYATVLSNPYEFLIALADTDKLIKDKITPFNYNNPESILLNKEIYSKGFSNDEALTIIRYPHITMGNLWVTKNKKLKDIDDYFNLSKEIVVVNSINHNILQRLNGMDFDSDSVMMTNNPILYKRAKENENRFKVPVNLVEPIKESDIQSFRVDLSKPDSKISNNKVGTVVNYATCLNCLYWDTFHKNKNDPKLEDIYKDICILAVLSNMEIDSAKRPYPLETSLIISKLNEKYCYEYKDKNGEIKKSNWPKMPLCFEKSEKKNSLKMKNGMEVGLDYMVKYLLDHPLTNSEEKEVTFESLISSPYPKKYNGHDKKAIDKLDELVEEIDSKFKEEKKGLKMREDVFMNMNAGFQRILDEYEKEVIKCINNKNRARMAIRKLDDYSKNNISYAWILLYYFMCREGSKFKDLLGRDYKKPGLRMKTDKDKEYITLFGHKMALFDQDLDVSDAIDSIDDDEFYLDDNPYEDYLDEYEDLY